MVPGSLGSSFFIPGVGQSYQQSGSYMPTLLSREIRVQMRYLGEVWIRAQVSLSRPVYNG